MATQVGQVKPSNTQAGEWLVVAIATALLVVVGVVAAGAWLAVAFSGGRVSVDLAGLLAVAARLMRRPGDPTWAWRGRASGLPAPWLYWACTGLAAGVAAAALAAAVVVWRRVSPGDRRRLGVETEARLASVKDVAPLVVEHAVPPSGRLLLGRLAPRGPMLATEVRPVAAPDDRSRSSRRKSREHARTGDRGSVALIGPTRSGKTVLAAGGMIGWDGPVVALSVKRDLFDVTAASRSPRGSVAVFDPSGVTGLPTARWTPLREVTSTSGAARAGRALAQAIPRNGVSGGDFWAAHGETLTSAYMALAGLSQLLPNESGGVRERLTIGRLAAWAYLHVGVTDPTVNELIRSGLSNEQPLEVRLLARSAMTKLLAFEGEDPRIRASIYATARLAFEAWNEPAVAHSASLDPRAFYWDEEIWDRAPRYVDLEWLMDGGPQIANSLYLTAPATEFARLSPVLGGLLGDLREQIHAWDVSGRRLPKPLLIVIDEAGQLELQWLPEEVSTIAGLGGMFVTGWQSKAQIAHRYGTLADAVLGGHRSKVVFNGTDDPATLDYVSRIAGTEHVAQRGSSRDAAAGRVTISEHPQREDLLPGHVVRQMGRHEAVLLHGTLPPAHLRVVQWWNNGEILALIPHDTDGRVLPPPSDGTCPLGEVRAAGAGLEPVFDQTALLEALASLPRPASPKADDSVTLGSAAQAQPELFAAGVVSPPVDRNRVAAWCDRCGTSVAVGHGVNRVVDGRVVVECFPLCRG